MASISPMPTEIPSGLPSELLDKLALLRDAPAGIAESTIALLPYGSRSALAAYQLIERIPAEPHQASEIRITDRGRALIEVCAERMSAAPARVH